jgi:hypothetical protein
MLTTETMKNFRYVPTRDVSVCPGVIRVQANPGNYIHH